MTDKKSTGIALILCAAVLWGTTGTAQSFATSTLSAYWVGAARLAVSAGFFILWLSLTDRHALGMRQIRKLPWRLVFATALSMVLYNLTFFAGVREVGVATGTAIALGSGPIWAGLLETFWRGKRPGLFWWLAVSVAVFGLLIATSEALNANRALQLASIALCLISGLSYAVFAGLTKRLLEDTSAGVTTASVFIVAAVLATPFAWLISGQPVYHTADLAVMLWLGVAATGIAYLLFTYGLRHVNSSTGVALALAEPIAAVVFAITLVDERPSMIALSGMTLVFVGLCLIIRAETS